jgi:Uma2 family endonuclease
VEILSPSSRRKDRDLKLRLYRRAGVGEYWIVDPQSRQVEQYRREGDLLVAAGTFSDRIAFGAVPGVVVDLTRVWDEADA